MKVTKKEWEKWRMLRTHGDVKILSIHANVSRVTITKALNKGECSVELFSRISEFYNNRQNLMTCNTH